MGPGGVCLLEAALQAARAPRQLGTVGVQRRKLGLQRLHARHQLLALRLALRHLGTAWESSKFLLKPACSAAGNLFGLRRSLPGCSTLALWKLLGQLFLQVVIHRCGPQP